MYRLKKGDLLMIHIPTRCPSCDSELERVKDQLFCRNPLCGDTARKRVSNYCKKRKIKGLAEKSIEKMQFSSVTDIYTVTEEELTKVLGKNGSKIYTEIEITFTILPYFSFFISGTTA